MELARFKITYCPFPNSDATSELEMFEKDEDDALRRFTLAYPLWATRVKEVKGE